MQGSLTIARVWGIPIGLHFSWFLVFGLISWSLAGGYFPEKYPGWPVTTYALVGAAASLLFFGSVLVHELGHSWVALRNAIPIRSLTLFVFGGIAQIGRDPGSPGVEFRIAIAGPLTSLGLAGLFGTAWLLTRDVAVVAAPMIWLARINLTLALFNLIPGFPLDGGRVFRAVVWRWTGSFHQATQVASVTGQIVAFGFIGLGVLTVLRGNVLGGVWMAFIGWFLQNAAAASYAQASLRELLSGVTVAHAMTRDCPRVAGDLPLDRLVQEEVLGKGRRCFLIADDGHLRGLLTLHEVKAVPRERWGQVRVDEIMTRPDRLTTVTPQEDLLGALAKMDDANVAQMPVVAGDELLGMLSREQVLHYVRVRAELGI
ncbi:MAG: site-2 protease family protein [Candidatus Rokubacteria bacterium]|nr:site-2 protease family protein [Candidatus Rokubacteria bacterium]